VISLTLWQLVSAPEPFHAAFGVDDALLAGEEWVTVAADFNVHRPLR